MTFVLGVIGALACLFLMLFGVVSASIGDWQGYLLIALGAFGFYQIVWTWLHNRRLDREMERR